ncbi:GTPase regulator Nrf1 [Linderina macrospora]|uniref:GTPase regulator Nrf1 n=1 Tax=Linderina macrospora TaxID=4868 RepID=A0ACC1JCR3_9FUNG|nr:GTPase regulator Nrf1 [Linderina macrospora]
MNADASVIAIQGHRQDSTSYGSVPFVARHDQPGKRIAVPVRVEPKVFFANERTFLSWLNFAIVLGSLALGLLNFGDSTGKIAGAAFTIVAMCVMVYALMLFQWRAERIRQRDSGPYDDRKGPTVLVAVLICAILVNFYLRFTHAS